MILFGLWIPLHSHSAKVVKRATANEELSPLGQQAFEFDRFLRDQLSQEGEKSLVHKCQRDLDASFFCESILLRRFYEQKVREKKETRYQSKKEIRQKVYPQIDGDKILNWESFRLASTNATLTPVAELSPERKQILKGWTLKETRCPMEIAVSVASAFEDTLPESSNLELAELYDKGGRCLPKDQAERSSLLTRAGLFYLIDKKYDLAQQTLQEATQVPQTVVSRPLYWLYRSQLSLGATEEAAKTLEQLVEKYPITFHAVLAQLSQGKDPAQLLLRSQPKVAKRSEWAPALNTLLEQIEILRQYRLEESALKILEWAFIEAPRVEPEIKIYLANLNRNSSDFHPNIELLSDVLYSHPSLITKTTLQLYFPKPFFRIFQTHAKSLDPYLLLAIARKESTFDPKARSSADAYGLLQIQPGTAKRFGVKKDPKQLFDPDTNVKVGAKYFQKLLDRMGDQIHLALAAYNVGPERVLVWKKRYIVPEAILFVDLIPYKETRDYVGLVLRDYYWYRRLEEMEPPALFKGLQKN